MAKGVKLSDENLDTLQKKSSSIQKQNNNWTKLQQRLNKQINEDPVGKIFSTQYTKGKKICNKLMKLAGNLVDMQSGIDDICTTCQTFVTNNRRLNDGGDD